MATVNGQGEAQQQRPLSIRLARVVRASDAKVIKDRYNVTVESDGAEVYHSFPNIETETLLAVREVDKYINASDYTGVIQIGGPVPTRDGTWFCSPHRLVDHTTRLRVKESSGSCTCDPSECSHVVPWCAVFTHSAASMKFTDVYNIVKNTEDKVGFVIAHRYDGIAGNFAKGELKWHRTAVDRVFCERADGLQWEADACDWLRWEPFISEDGVHLHSELLTSFGNTYVYRVTIGHDLVMNYGWGGDWKVGVLADEQVNVTYSLTSIGSKSQRAVSFEWYKFGFENVLVYPGVVFITGRETRDIPICKAILWNTQSWFMNKPRNTAANLAAVTRYVRSQYELVTNLPEELKYRAQMVTVTLVMSECVELEMSVLSELNYRMSRIWDVHADTVQMDPPTRVDKVDVLAGTFWAALSVATLKSSMSYLGLTYTPPPTAGFGVKTTMLLAKTAAVVASSPHVPLLVPVWALATVAGAAYGAVKRYDLTGNRHKTLAAEEWARTPPGEAPPPLLGGVYPIPAGIKFHGTDAMKATKEVTAADSWVSVPPVAPRKEAKPKLELVGIAFSDTQPTYFEGTPAQEHQAISNRLGQGREADDEEWMRIGKAYREHETMKKLYTHINVEPIIINNKKCQEYASKFPRSQQSVLMEQYDDYRKLGCKMPEYAYKTKGFGKCEKAVKQSLHHDQVDQPVNEEGTARAIIAMHPMMSVVYGTLIHQYEVRKKTFLCEGEETGVWSPICPKGVSAEKRAMWFDYWVDKFGGEDQVIYLAGDKSSYDGSFTASSFREGIDSSYGSANVSPPQVTDQVRKSHEKTRGTTYGGVKYSLDAVMGSGSSATSAVGTVVNEMGTTYGLAGLEVDRLGKDFVIACEGDDDFNIVRRSYFEEHFKTVPDAKEMIAERWARLGFTCTPVISVNLFEVDYLSKLWYPAEGTRILGGKIGRVLSRAGYFLDIKDEQTLRGAAISSFQDNHHVPFLREYFARVLELTVGQKVRGKVSEYSVHTSRAHEYDEETLRFVEARYGLTREHLAEFVKLLSEVKRLPVVISWSHYARCVQIDSS